MNKIYCIVVFKRGELSKKFYFDNFLEAYDFRKVIEKEKDTITTVMTDYNVQDGKSKIA